jgi:hypothetical protein
MNKAVEEWAEHTGQLRSTIAIIVSDSLESPLK